MSEGLHYSTSLPVDKADGTGSAGTTSCCPLLCVRAESAQDEVALRDASFSLQLNYLLFAKAEIRNVHG